LGPSPLANCCCLRILSFILAGAMASEVDRRPSLVSEEADASSVTSSFVRDGSQWGFSGWSRDDKVPNCPRCSAPFSMTFRRHHCKQCGNLVCDDCSRHRVRLPRFPTAGKVRVCDQCAKDLAEDQAVECEEDLAVNTEIIKQIQRALKKMHEETDAHKVVLLELDAEATGDRSKLEQYLRDPEADCHSFPLLRDRTQQQWVRLLASLDTQSVRRSELEARQKVAQGQLEEAKSQEQELLSKKAELDAQMVAMDRARAERDELVRKETDLERQVAEARRQVQELEMERKERLERQAEQRTRLQLGRLSFSGRGSPRPAASPSASPQIGPAAFTISTGRQDPLLAGHGGTARNRLEGCRRSCAVQ